MTILVTGGAGFIGSNFVLEWLRSGDESVINLDKLTYAGNLANLKSLSGDRRHVFIQGDICDSRMVADILKQYQPRAIVHFAAESHVDRSIHGPAAFVQTNILGTFNLLEQSRAWWRELPGEIQGSFRFVHVSTDEVYGSLGPHDPPFSESHPYSPNSPYSASKASSDHLARAYHHTYGLPVVTTNCSNNYGPYQFPEKLIPLMILNALRGKQLPVYGDGKNVRDWLHVSDHCCAIREVLNKGIAGHTYNIGGNCERTNLQVVNAICAALDRLAPKQGPGYAGQITYVPDRPGHDRRYAIDCRKLTSELGWSPSHQFESGLEQTIRWYLSNQDWVKGVESGTYKNWVNLQYGVDKQ